jgi:hypothetical protein
MFKRKRWLIAVVLLALLMGAGFWIALALREPEHGVTPELVARIQEGMTAEAVETIIGLPPGGYREDVRFLPGRVKHKPPSVVGNNTRKVTIHETLFWVFEVGWVNVHLDASQRVIDVQAQFYTPWQRVRRHFWQTVRSAGVPDL